MRFVWEHKSGGNARLTVYPETMHDSWTATYKNPEVFAWLLSHENENGAEVFDQYHDSKVYG